MAEYTNREAFIPYRKSDVIKLCVEDGKLSQEDTQKFKEFCEILSAYYHFEFHEKLENLKENFAPFDPDADTHPLHEPSAKEEKQMEEKLVATLHEVLESANFSELTKEQMDKAMEEESLITLRMDIDFDDFDQMVCFHRGDGTEVAEVKKGLLRILKERPFSTTEEIEVDVFKRVVLLLKFKDQEYFYKKNKKKLKKLNFTPGKTYLYLYKNIPKADLEVIFPNIEISMNWKDRLLLIGPAIVGAIPVFLKILPSLLLIAGAIALFVKAPEIANQLGVNEEQAKNLLPLIFGAASGLAVLGGFMFRQYVKYKNKRIAFLKEVADTLFFKNLDTNTGVFHSVIDSAEEEENKEIILAYYHLLTSERGLTQQQLDDQIEEWFEKNHNTEIDFDVEKALQKMKKIKGVVERDGKEVETPLLWEDENGVCHILTIDESKTVIDYVWDNIFSYNNG